MNKSCSFWKQPRMWVKVFKINVKEGKSSLNKVCVCVCSFSVISLPIFLHTSSSSFTPSFSFFICLFPFTPPSYFHHPSSLFIPSSLLLSPFLSTNLPFFYSLPVSSPHPLLFSFSLIPSCSLHSLPHSSLSLFFLIFFSFSIFSVHLPSLLPSLPPSLPSV